MEFENKNFFDELKGIVKDEVDCWPVDELKNYSQRIELPQSSIKLDSSGFINYIKKKVEVNISVAKLHSGKRICKPNFERLIHLKDYL